MPPNEKSRGRNVLEQVQKALAGERPVEMPGLTVLPALWLRRSFPSAEVVSRSPSRPPAVWVSHSQKQSSVYAPVSGGRACAWLLLLL